MSEEKGTGFEDQAINDTEENSGIFREDDAAAEGTPEMPDKPDEISRQSAPVLYDDALPENEEPGKPMSYKDEYIAAEERPMSYRDAAQIDPGANAPQQLPLFVPAGNGMNVDDLLFPPFSAPGKRKGIYIIRTVLWMLSVVVVAMAIFLIFRLMNRQEETEPNSNSKVPYNYSMDTSYAEQDSIPGAPQASADPDGPQISTSESDDNKATNTVNSAYRKASPSVVCITSYKGGEDYVLDKLGDGSGIIISEDGYIATNSHVIDDDKTTGVLVTLSDGTQYLGAIVGMDPKTDLAVLKIDAKKLTPAEFADSDKLFVGQEVYAIGNPGGSNFSNSLTKGTVSAVNRTLSNNGYVRYIQTDAAINPGNSGGPLINENGQVIGMNTSKIVNTKYEGMGFSIPSNKVAEVINKLIKYGFVNDRGTIGIEGTTCNLYESKLKNVPEGMVITYISPKGALKDLDVRNMDIITAVNAVRVKSAMQFIDELSKYKPGDTVTLSIFRASDSKTMRPYSFEVDVTLLPDN